jgi:hypothetical protein
MAANRVVSKKELEESGLTLRDFLNRERGLTRKEDSDVSSMKSKRAGQSGYDESGDVLSSVSDQASSAKSPTQTASFAYKGDPCGSGKRGRMPYDVKAEDAARLNNLNSAYTGRRDPNASARAALSSGNSDEAGNPMKRGGKVKKMASGGSASSRADGCCTKGKTRGKMV